MQEADEPVNLEDDLESRLDQAVRLKWATGFSSTAPKVDGHVVNREFPFVLSSYGFIHFGVIINIVTGRVLHVNVGTAFDGLLNTHPSILYCQSTAFTHLFLELECISASATGSTTLSVPLSGAGSRHVSSGEVKYLRPLLKTYGNNIEGMAGDLKLNPEQRTVGQLRRALKKAGL